MQATQERAQNSPPALGEISLRDYFDRKDGLGGIRLPNGGVTRLSDVLNDDTQGFFTRASLEQIVRSVIQQLVAAGGTLPQGMLPKQAVAPAPRKKPTTTAADLGLTRREAEVLRVLAQGKSNKEIGRELNIAQGTVKVHMRAVCEKLNVTRRTEAIVLVNRMGLALEG